MTKHKKTKRKNQKGGLFAQSWSDWSSSLWNKTKEKLSSGTDSIETGLGDISEKTSSSVSSLETISEGLGKLNPFSSNESFNSSSYSSTPISGGKRKNKYGSKKRRTHRCHKKKTCRHKKY
jgi:hypothetical protein